MKLKYYVRTLGLGIFVTALLMGFATTPKVQETRDGAAGESILNSNKVLSEVASTTEENREEAKETKEEESVINNQSEDIADSEDFGQGEESAEGETEGQSEVIAESQSESQSNDTVEGQEEAAISREEGQSEEGESTVESETAETKEQITESVQESSPEESSFVSLEIRRGDSSDKVSRQLEELGLVEDAKSFDRYLCNNGYDKRISVGSYSIPIDSSEEEIALIISGKKR